MAKTTIPVTYAAYEDRAREQITRNIRETMRDGRKKQNFLMGAAVRIAAADAASERSLLDIADAEECGRRYVALARAIYEHANQAGETAENADKLASQRIYPYDNMR